MGDLAIGIDLFGKVALGVSPIGPTCFAARPRMQVTVAVLIRRRFILRRQPQDEPTAYEYRNGHLHARSRGKARWTYRRNAQGDLTEQIDPDGQVTHYHYDAQGQLTGIRYPDHSLHTLGWNGLGQLIEEQLPNGGQRRYAYDVLGRQIRRQD